MAHNDSHPFNENCWGCTHQNFSVGASAMPTRKAPLIERQRMDKTMETDVAAYKRLRKEGLQPKATKGARNLEVRANSRFEVESGQMLGAPEKIGRLMDETQTAINKGEITV